MIEHKDHLIPECYADTLLIRMLLNCEPNHQKSLSAVLKTIEVKFSNRKAIGMIDDDKVKYSYYNKFSITVKENEYYRYLSHPNKKHHLIVLKKDFEHFILACAGSVGMKHKYLDDVKTLKKYSKSQNIDMDNDFKNVINALIQKKATPLMEIQQILFSHLKK